jgi:hypothetical protein
MKHLLILLLFPALCFSQKTITFEQADSLSKKGVFIIVKLDSTTRKPYYQIPTPDTIYTIRPLIEKYDTVLVVMLMCDTSERSVDDLGQVYWQLGYEVRKGGISIDYLDSDKLKLPKNIIVWQSKQF